MTASIEAPGMRPGFRATIYTDGGSVVATAFFPAIWGDDWSRCKAAIEAAYAAAKAWVALYGCN